MQLKSPQKCFFLHRNACCKCLECLFGYEILYFGTLYFAMGKWRSANKRLRDTVSTFSDEKKILFY